MKAIEFFRVVVQSTLLQGNAPMGVHCSLRHGGDLGTGHVPGRNMMLQAQADKLEAFQ